MNFKKLIRHAYVEVTSSNRDEVARRYNHPFTEDLNPGSLVWGVPRYGGDSLAVVWAGEGRGGIGINGTGMFEGRLSERDGELLLVTVDGRTIDLNSGTFVGS